MYCVFFFHLPSAMCVCVCGGEVRIFGFFHPHLPLDSFFPVLSFYRVYETGGDSSIGINARILPRFYYNSLRFGRL